MVLLCRLTLLSPPEVGTVSGQAGGLVDETLVWNQVMLDAIVAAASAIRRPSVWLRP